MAKCKKCGEHSRWLRSCSQCRSWPDRADTVADAAGLAAEAGLFGWIGRGLMGVARLVLRALD